MVSGTADAEEREWDRPDFLYFYVGIQGGYSGSLGAGLEGAGYSESSFFEYWHVNVGLARKPSVSRLAEAGGAMNVTKIGAGHLQIGGLVGVYQLGLKPVFDGQKPETDPDGTGGTALGPEIAYHIALGPLRLRPVVELEYGVASSGHIVKGLLASVRLHATLFVATHFLLFGDVGYSIVRMKADTDAGTRRLESQAAQAHIGFAIGSLHLSQPWLRSQPTLAAATGRRRRGRRWGICGP